MDGRDLVIVDLDSGEEVENVASMCWGKGSILTSTTGAVLTDEHVDVDKDYLVIVVECDSATRF